MSLSSRRSAALGLARSTYPWNARSLELRKGTPVFVEENDDDLKVMVESVDHPTLLFVSRQYHPHWQAMFTGVSGAVSTEPVVVDGFYLGVVIPPAQRSVDLYFRPWARWMWLSHASIAVALLWVLTFAWRARCSASTLAAAAG